MPPRLPQTLGAEAARAAALGAWQLEQLRRWRAEAPEWVVVVVDEAMAALPPSGPAWHRFVPRPPAVHDLVTLLADIARDPRPRGVVLHLRALQLPATSIETLRAAVAGARAAGKRVVAWSSGYTLGGYRLAAACDVIALQKGGHVGPLGMGHRFVHVADGLARAGLAFEAVQISPYKTAADAFTRRSPSPEARAMAEWLLDGAWAEAVADIAAGRGWTAEAAQAALGSGFHTDLEARAAGLVDVIASEEELPALLASADGVPVATVAAPAPAAAWAAAPAASDGPPPARLAPARAVRRSLILPPPPAAGPGVAVLRIEGVLVDGDSAAPPGPLPVPLVGDGRSGDRTVVEQARRLVDDDAVAAVVVHVDSPGGSATASEAMAAALERVAARKPVVAHFGAMAASGGYYVATAAHRIVAQPSTLTGSIGVVTGKLVAGALWERLGIAREVLARGGGTALFDADTPWTAADRARIDGHVRRVYDVFLARVATARALPLEALDAVAGGRVFTGRQAQERGLVDDLGTLDDALALARRLAGVSSRAPSREVRPPRRRRLPAAAGAGLAALTGDAGAAAAAVYVLDTLRRLNGAAALCLCPWIDDPSSPPGLG